LCFNQKGDFVINFCGDGDRENDLVEIVANLFGFAVEVEIGFRLPLGVEDLRGVR